MLQAHAKLVTISRHSWLDSASRHEAQTMLLVTGVANNDLALVRSGHFVMPNQFIRRGQRMWLWRDLLNTFAEHRDRLVDPPARSLDRIRDRAT